MIIGIIGATGLVGKVINKYIYELINPTDAVLLYSSSGDDNTHVFSFNILHDLDYAFLATPNKLSRVIYEYCKQHNLEITLIDSSSEFRMDKDIPLIIPEVNKEDMYSSIHTRLIASPNCTTTFLAMLLRALNTCGEITDVVLSTYQAASGAGIKGLDELELQTKQYISHEPITQDFWKQQYIYNIFSHNSPINEDGFNEEEMKIINETQKILHKKINITPTCIRVPVLYCHSESINVVFDREVKYDDILNSLNFPGIKVENLPTPVQATGKTDVFVGRIRSDLNNKRKWNFFLCADQTLKGAGYNSIQIFKELIAN